MSKFEVKNLTFPGALKMAAELNEIDDKIVNLDFSKVTKVRMSGMIYFLRTIEQLKNSGKKFQYYPGASTWKEPSSAISYAGHVGFFKALGIDYGKDPGEALGSYSYLPITKLTLAGLYKLGESIDIHDGITKYSEKLAQILADGNEALETVFTYLIIEMVRNPFEHAVPSAVWVGAQKHPTEGTIEVIIADDAQGVRQTLSINRDFSDLTSDEIALRKALKPGISGKKYAPKKADDFWQNSGFGLYVTSELTSSVGVFNIVSGDTALGSSGNGFERYSDANISFTGTFIRLRINTNKIEKLTPDSIKALVKKGEKSAGETDGAIKVASKASKMGHL